MKKRIYMTNMLRNTKALTKEEELILHRERNSRLEQHTKIFASMCPDEILDYYDNYETREYHATLMLGDVSGFTDLTEKYTKTGVGGPSKLSEILNSYIGAMVQEILSHNGDVVKFSGDAFIVMWKLEDQKFMRHIVTEAMQTACIIQKHFGTYDTDVGVTLKVKLAIASGKIYFTSIGDPKTMSYYVMTGKTVWDVKSAEKLCRGGDIIVTPSTWRWANPNEYIYEKLPDRIHILIIACRAAWYQSGALEIRVDTEPDIRDNERHDGDMFDLKPRKTDNEAMINRINDTEYEFEQVDYSLRPKIIEVAKAQLKNSLRSYILRPVIRSVEINEPLEHLTEMRQVVILFINVITTDVDKDRLVPLVDMAYKLVCRVVCEMHGCVNKTSLFDKDLIFLCIFGLRGDKHELESQIGLRCAFKLRHDLLAMRNVESVTIAVTTGMTYCGVVGHILRREYTVIGMSVNKAARLMIAYNNKVICDRETFLHSRLETKHFILQEAKYLKGITKVGPVYEFQEQIKSTESELICSNYPLLGRKKEIKMFRQMLMNLMGYSAMDKTTLKLKPKYNTLIIKGEPRIGKTRLLDEMAQNVPTDVPCNYISLIVNDSKTSYGLIQLIFSTPLGFNAISTSEERENRLMSQLGHVRRPDFLCALNQPFNVHFTMSQSYLALRVEQKRKVLNKFLFNLMQNCFKKLSIVIIDNAQYSDSDSMLLFHIIVQCNAIFFILAIGHRFNQEYEVHPAFLERARIIELSYMDKLYYAALTCQVLNVYGISPELERLIQERSLGNPGWIESYLISLMQSGGLVIQHIHKTIAEERGYVLPPITMLERFELKNTFLDNEEEPTSDKWTKMYRTSYRNNSISLPNNAVHKAETPLDEEKTIAVCKFTEDFVPEEGNAEVTVDVMILKIFDSLTPLDQLLLKCASVLGEIINRNMLEDLMKDKSIREIGLAIQKLFDIKIFACARGHFTASISPLVFYKSTRRLSMEIEATCDCVGLTMRKELADLPPYASCGLMRFKMSMFRETTYRSLTENHKLELHSKALKYLRQYTKRCTACGELQFARLLGKTIQEGKRTLTIKLPEALEEIIYIVKEEMENDMQQVTEKPACLDLFRKVTKLAKTFSNVDFANCQCHLILMTVYAQILEHCQGIGKQDMILTAILEFVEICLAGNNIPQARRLLNDAEVSLQQMFRINEEKSLLLSYLAAKIRTLQGRCYLESGFFSEAKKELTGAMDSLGYYFPQGEFMIKLESTIQFELLKWRLIRPKRWTIDTVDELTANYTEQLANCLAQMFDVFKGTKRMKKRARLAAIWSLNAALDSSRDFLTLCTSFTNMMLIAHVYQNKLITPCLEKRALSICAKKGDLLEFQELKAIAELYAAIFFSRWLNGEINKAIRIGFITIRMAQTMDSVFLKLLILPRLAHLLMISCRHSEIVTLLRELEFASRNELDKSGRTWYYAICADVQLDTGLTILSFHNCEQYYLQEGEAIISLQDPEAERRYFTSMWLWCIRTQQWEAMKIWSSKNVTAESVVDEHKITATITALKNLEGLLILYVREITNRNINALNTMVEIKNEFKRIKNMIKIVKIAVPRYMLIKAYYYIIQARKSTAIRMLQQTKKLSMKVDNKMIYAWAEHCQQAWLHAMSSVRKDLWSERPIKIEDEWDEINANDSAIIPFTFPLPKYVS